MRTSDILNDLLARVTDAGRALSGLGDKAAVASPETLADLCETLLSGRGEATGLALGRDILNRFASLSDAEKLAFFTQIRTNFGVDTARLAKAYEAWQAHPDDDTARALHFASEPRSQQLIRLLNRVPGGTAALVGLRADLLRAMKENPALEAIDADFLHLFSSWFNRGFLQLRAIDWSTPAAILEKVIVYEAVHAIEDWDDLRRRVAAPDRRLYAFFHPALPAEPLIFVEVALTDGIPGAIPPILARNRKVLEPAKATTAVFYSISNCQAGLRGVSFGNFLIKQVVEELQRDFNGIKQFVTLSPVPGLRGWAKACETLEPEQAATVAALEDGQPVEQDAVRGLAARYLVTEKARRGGALDPVARFHLGNGARLEQIHPDGDPSPRGRGASWGVMVNYLYDLDDIEKNHETYANSGTVASSGAVRRLIRARKPVAS
jgi:malonyl-CoA decarboxylase